MPAHAAEIPGLSRSETSTSDTATANLAFVMRMAGVVEVGAILAVFIPSVWMAEIHTSLGLGPMPATPLFGYLARSTSLLWAFHGLLVIALASDIRRYQPLIQLLGKLTVAFGACLLVIDLVSHMPLWWTAVEGPIVIAMGITFVALNPPPQTRSSDDDETVA